MDYRQAGVDIDEGMRAVDRIKAAVGATGGPGVMGGIGGFGGLFDLAATGVTDPVLVSSVDGVGTKLTVARMVGDHSTVGQDLVNHCVNDILVQGARPLFFMDYVAMGKLDSDVVVAVVEGMARACRDNGCALLGGETAEMPGMYADGDFDVVGCIVGAVERAGLLDGSRVAVGDVVVGLDSTGLHTNGYSLARAILFDRKAMAVTDPLYDGGPSVGEALLAVHRTYLPSVGPSLAAGRVNGLAHITGGGLIDNVPRILPAGTDCEIRLDTWEIPPLFALLGEWGDVPRDELFRAFNMGIGMAVVCPESEAAAVLEDARGVGVAGRVIGRIVAGDGQVRLVD